MMKVEVVRSSTVVVRPSEPGTPAGSNDINLSSFDECFACVPISSLLVFEHPIEEPVKTIQRAVSQALVHYHPLAGRLVAGAGDGELRIACTREGVSFVGATAACSLEDVPTSTLLKELVAVHYPAALCSDTDALLLMQVTEFRCGGFVVAATWNHAVADGAGMAQFLRAVGDLARGMPAPSTPPVRSHEAGSLPVLPPATVAIYRFVTTLANKEMAAVDITVPWSLVRRIQADFDGGEPCTVFEAVAAVLWRCRTRAVVSGDLDVPAPLSFSYNLRSHVGAEDGYYGNCFTMVVHATSGAVANGDIGDLVKLIKRGKETILDTLNGVSAGTEQAVNVMYNILSISSWRNLGFDGVDVGHGGPARVMWHMEQASGPCCVVCPPCEGKDDGVNVQSLFVKQEHVDAFLGELASM